MELLVTTTFLIATVAKPMWRSLETNISIEPGELKWGKFASWKLKLVLNGSITPTGVFAPEQLISGWFKRPAVWRKISKQKQWSEVQYSWKQDDNEAWTWTNVGKCWNPFGFLYRVNGTCSDCRDGFPSASKKYVSRWFMLVVNAHNTESQCSHSQHLKKI